MRIKTYITSKDTTDLVTLKDLSTNLSGHKIIIDKSKTYQTWLGFGGAFTEASGYNYAKLDNQLKKEVIDKYFSKDGLNYNLGRITMGSCDFSLDCYDYLETGTLDYSRDDKYVMPLVNDALGKKHNIAFLVSPWSPPAHMKTNGIRNYGGKLKAECYLEYAEYYVNYLKNLKGRGLNVEYLSIQNEPAATQTWDSCLYSPMEEYELAKIIYQKLKEEQLDTKILVWDHNRDIFMERVQPIFDIDKENIIYGSAIHWYDNEPFQNVLEVSTKYPTRHILHTESCIERKPGKYYDSLERYARNIIGNMNANCEAYIDWNLFLDEIGGPNWVQNFCDAPIIIGDNNYTLQYSYYGIAHLSKFIEVGAVRIDLKIEDLDLFSTAFMNPDGKVIIVILNQTDNNYVLSLFDKSLNLKEKSIITIVLEDE